MNKLISIGQGSAQLIRGETGKRTICVKRQNGKEIFIHSRVNPRESAKFISDYTFREQCDIVFLFGLGLGYELREMQKNNPKKVYFVVEPDFQIFNCNLMVNDIQPVMNEINLFVGNNENQIIQALNYIIDRYKSIKIQFVVLPPYKALYKELWTRLVDQLRKLLNGYVVAINTNNSQQKKWARNYVMNLDYFNNTHPLEKLTQSFANKPAIIVGAGPSLEENIEALKLVQNKAVIAAVGSGAAILESHGIKAHIIGAMDGNKAEERIFNNLKYNADSMLFYSSQVYYTVPNLIKGSKFLMNQVEMDEYLHKKLNWECSSRYSGPSIANVITNNLSELGCNPIIILGQDMCYSKNKLYADGAKHKKEFTKQQLENDPAYIKTVNNKGEEVYTTPALMSFKYESEGIIKNHPKTVYLNGTNHGLTIEGSQNIDFNEYYNNKLSNDKDIDFPVFSKDIKTNECADKVKNDLFNELHRVIDACEEIVKSIQKNTDNIVNIINKNEKVLSTVPLYVNVLMGMLEFIEYLLPKDYLGNILNRYLYVLDKCYIMEKAFQGQDIVKE
ncbi:MAG: hypothetical protein K0R54_5467 [Clostridiaceae bacterium]|nr:hypothetical protein [Clostridiaceae bacterium]